MYILCVHCPREPEEGVIAPWDRSYSALTTGPPCQLWPYHSKQAVAFAFYNYIKILSAMTKRNEGKINIRMD